MFRKIGLGASILLFLIFFWTDGCTHKENINVPVIEMKNGEKVTILKEIIVEPYGLFTSHKKIEGIEYELSVGNIVWSAITIWSVLTPGYLVGWALYQPVGLEKEKIVIDKTVKVK
jgi:hypothetical protein